MGRRLEKGHLEAQGCERGCAFPLPLGVNVPSLFTARDPASPLLGTAVATPPRRTLTLVLLEPDGPREAGGWVSPSAQVLPTRP